MKNSPLFDFSAYQKAENTGLTEHMQLFRSKAICRSKILARYFWPAGPRFGLGYRKNFKTYHFFGSTTKTNILLGKLFLILKV